MDIQPIVIVWTYAVVFLILGVFLFTFPLYKHKKKMVWFLWGYVIFVVLFFVIPNDIAMIVWFLVNKLHWIP
ncbi:MAG: hypothetical protein ACOY3K_03305 [Candidatus Omnitrophota bacterium]